MSIIAQFANWHRAVEALPRMMCNEDERQEAAIVLATNPRATLGSAVWTTRKRLSRSERCRTHLPLPRQLAGEQDDVDAAIDNAAEVARILAALTPAQRQIARMIMAGYSPAEIADLLTTRPANVYAALHNMRKRLQKA